MEKGKEDGPLLRRWIGSAMREAKSEVIIASPYLVPGDGGMRLLESLRQRNVRISVLTNSLASTDVPMVHAAYQHYRERMVKDGIELYEARPMSGQPGNAGDKSGGSGDTSEGKSAGQFTLHDKIFIFDRKRAFIGSMNFDRRSLRINTEGGLLIDSPELARQLVDRFDAITSPAKSYHVVLGPAHAFGRQPLVWRTEESGRIVDENAEPKGDLTRAIKAELLTLLPLDDLL